MDGFLEGLLGGLLASIGINIKKLKPWNKALIMLALFWIVFLPLFIFLEKIDFTIFLSSDFWLFSLAIYLFIFFFELLLLWGKKINERKKNEDDNL